MVAKELAKPTFLSMVKIRTTNDGYETLEEDSLVASFEVFLVLMDQEKELIVVYGGLRVLTCVGLDREELDC